jgi:hypothetical protein
MRPRHHCSACCSLPCFQLSNASRCCGWSRCWTLLDSLSICKNCNKRFLPAFHSRGKSTCPALSSRFVYSFLCRRDGTFQHSSSDLGGEEARHWVGLPHSTRIDTTPRENRVPLRSQSSEDRDQRSTSSGIHAVAKRPRRLGKLFPRENLPPSPASRLSWMRRLLLLVLTGGVLLAMSGLILLDLLLT